MAQRLVGSFFSLLLAMIARAAVPDKLADPAEGAETPEVKWQKR